MTVFTIGYEGLDVTAFLSLLSKHDINTVVDIRELPLSRKRGFSKRSLAELLREEGFGYIHMADLGCPRQVRNQYRADGSWKRYTEGFLVHLEGQTRAIEELSDLVADRNCALLCFEADHRFCHRSFVADAVNQYSGADVRHIQVTSAASRTAAPARARAVPA